MANEPEAKFSITANADGVVAAMRQAETAVKQGVSQITDHFNSLGAIVGKLNFAFAAVGAALAGGKLFGDAISETVNLTKESVALGKQFGITATQASILKVALGNAFVSQETLSTAGDKITRTLRENEKAFADLGVKTRGANGEFRGTFDIMQDVNKRLLQFREGTDRNIEGQKIYTKGWAEVAPILKLTEEHMTSAAAKADALGLVVGEESVEATQKYRTSLNDVGDVLNGMKKAIGDAVLPILTRLGEWFASIGPQAILVLKGALVVIIDAFYALKLAIETVVNFIVALWQSLAIKAISLADTISHALRGDFKGAKQAWQNGNDQIEDIQREFVESTKRNYKEAVDAVSNTMSRAFTKETPTVKKEGTETSTGGPDKKTADDRFKVMVNALEKIKEAEGRYRQEDLDSDLTYWQQKLATTANRTEADKQLRLKIEHEIFGIKKQIAAQELALAEEAIASNQNIAEEDIAARADAIKTKFELNAISQKQELKQLRDLEQQKFEIERKALQDRLKLVEADKIARAKIQDQLTLLSKQQEDARVRADHQGSIESQKYWQGIMQPIARTISSTVQNMLQGTMSLRKGLAQIGQSILQEFVNIETEKLAKTLASQAAQTEAAVTGSIIRADAEEAGAKRGLLATIAAALKTIAINAVKVISGVWAAISSIPIVGPFLAPVLAIAAGAAVYGLASRISSARGGYDIPGGVNPMTQLHENEMVLPANIAQPLKRQLANGGAGATQIHHYNINAVDAKSFLQMLSDPMAQRVMAAGIARQSRNLNPHLA